MAFPSIIQNLIVQLSKLPEIGPKAATRLVFYLTNQEQKELDELSALIKGLKTNIRLCSQCFNLAEADNSLCSICQDKKRDCCVRAGSRSIKNGSLSFSARILGDIQNRRGTYRKGCHRT
mgnify:CR=1 FL=1